MKSIGTIVLLLTWWLPINTAFSHDSPCLWQDLLPVLHFKKDIPADLKCDMPALPDIQFKKGSVFLTKQGKKDLDSITHVIRQYPSCKIAIIGYGNSCEGCVQTSWDRTYSVIKYLGQKGLEESRFIFYYGQEGGDPLTVSIRTAAKDEEGPSMISAPHPCYSYHHLTKHRCKDLHH